MKLNKSHLCWICVSACLCLTWCLNWEDNTSLTCYSSFSVHLPDTLPKNHQCVGRGKGRGNNAYLDLDSSGVSKTCEVAQTWAIGATLCSTHGFETSSGIYNKLMLVLLCEGIAHYFFPLKMATTKNSAENVLFLLQPLSIRCVIVILWDVTKNLVFSNITSPSAYQTSGFVSSRART